MRINPTEIYFKDLVTFGANIKDALHLVFSTIINGKEYIYPVACSWLHVSSPKDEIDSFVKDTECAAKIAFSKR